MEVQNNSIVKCYTDKLIYIEPNFISGGMDNVSVPLEDMSVYVELMVECIQTRDERDGNFVLKVRIDNDKPNVSLYNGVQYDSNSNDTFLSTEGYDNYTLTSLKEQGTEELFGVESIDISYNSFAVPEVVIKFTDIKGASLHGAEELAHDSEGNININNISLCSKFLSCFFTVPYPRFNLLIKGYYGKPVHYDLTCADFRSSFNSKSGNYDVTARLVGYSFALISDVNVCSLLAAPYSRYKGREYWEEQTKSGGDFFIDGVPMPTLSEIVKIYNDKYALLKPLEPNAQQNIQIINENYNDYIDLENSLKDLMINLGKIKKDSKKIFIVDFEKNKIFYLTDLSFSFFDNEDVKKTIEVYVNQINRIETKTPFKNRDFFNKNSWYKVNDLNGVDVSDEVKIELKKLKLDGVYNIYYYDFNNEFDYINRQQKRLEVSFNEDVKFQDELINEQMKDMFGFYPTIGNITKICFAHLETFLYMFESVKRFNQNSCDMLFPKILEENIDKTGVKTYLETWLGKRFNENERDEIKFVYGIYNGIKNVTQTDYFINTNDIENDRIYAYPGDLFEEHPYIKGFNKGFDEDIYVKRFFKIIESANYMFHDNVIKEIASNDANLFYAYNPLAYPNFNNDLLIDKFLEPIYKVDKNIIDITKFSRFSKKIRFYDIKNELLYNKNLVNVDNNKNVDYITLNADAGWSSSNFKFDFYFNHCTALLAKISNYSREVELSQHSYVFPNSNSNYDTVVSYNKIQRSYNDEEIAYIKSPNKIITKNCNVFNHAYYKLSNTMNHNNMTLLTIPSFCLDLNMTTVNSEDEPIKDKTHSGILYGSFLFSEEFYKSSDCIYSKAAMFLETFNWSNDITTLIRTLLRCDDTTTKNVTQLVEAVPYYVLLTIGASIYSFYTKKLYIIDNKNYEHANYQDGNGVNDAKKVNIVRRFKWDTETVKKMFDLIPKDSIDFLQKEFKKWVDNTYKKWDSVFMEEEKMLISQKNYNSPLYYVTVTSRGVYDNTYPNPTLKKVNCEDNLRPIYYRLFKETHPIVKEMTKQFFELKWLVKDNMHSVANKELAKRKFHIYAETFSEKINFIFNDVKENIRSQYFKNITSPRDYIDLNLYRYLKQIWDRWIISGNDYNDWKMVDVFKGENKRIHFIDPSYNDITNLIMVDIGKFVELIKSCKEHEDMPFLSFLSYFFRDNNCALHNVQNFINGQDINNLNQIFDTIPPYNFNPNDVKKFSDLIVMFSFQGAESQEDSFNLDDANNLPPSFKQNINGYMIPSFGVSYGMQNQNYFIDVDVSMTTPNITDQVLQATFQIADENSGNSATDNNSQIRSIGQDMYRVYSNHAYQCTVTMMGCAWVQPLMYFQLTNVPLFRGAYIIHKVTHNITPNNMVTKFVGTKVSKINIRKLESSYYFIKRDIAKKEYNIYQKTLSNVTNNCNYAHFPPYSEDRSSDSKDLAILLAHFNNIWYEDLTYGIYYSIMLHKTNDVINKTNNVIIENNLIFGLDVFLYNMWVANKASLTSETLFKFFNDLFIANSAIFVNPKEYEGKEEELVSYYKTHKDNINAILSSESGLIKCFSDIQGFVNMTANNPNIGFEQIDGCAILTSDLRQENVVYRVDDGNIGDIVFLKCQLDGQPHSYWGAMYNVTNEEVTIDNLIASFNKSMNESKNLKGLSLSISKNDGKEQKYVSKKTVRALLTLNNSASDEIKGQVFDMILQTYSHYLNHICWVVKNASSSHSIWDSIMIEMKTNNQFKVNVGYLNNVNQINTLVIESYDSLNTQFYMSIIKKYGINKSGGKYSSLFDSFKNECVNFNKLNSKKEWKNEVLNFFTTNDKTKGIDIKNCDDLIDEEINKAMEISYEQINGDFTIDVPSTQSFEGVGNKGQLLNKNQLQKITNSTAVVSVNEEEMDMLFLRYGYTEMNDSTDAWGETLAHYAYNNAIGDGGDCAKYVRMALEGALKTNTYNFSTNGRPESACRYWQFLNYWGFTCIYHGMSSQYNNTYQNGDIIVSAGLINGSRGIKDKHGHIQIYYKGKWYCDRMYPKANVYGTDRSCFIFRIANTFSNDFSTSISNANYKASESIINAIQHFEGFMPVWYPDSDSYSIGYGFKMTPDLSSKYPRTSANTCMAADRCGLIGKEKPNTKGCMTKQEANDYMRKTTLPTFENEFRQIMKDLPSYNQYQLDALFCLMYNIGPNGLKDKSPKLMQALKEQNLNNIVNEMNHGGSSHIKRRQWEQQLFREHKYPPYP